MPYFPVFPSDFGSVTFLAEVHRESWGLALCIVSKSTVYYTQDPDIQSPKEFFECRSNFNSTILNELDRC